MATPDRSAWLLLLALALPAPAVAQWRFAGLDGHMVKTLVRHEGSLYAGTDDGVRFTSLVSPDTTWMSAGLTGREVNGLVIVDPDTLLASTVISGAGADTISIFRTVDGGEAWEPFQNGFGLGFGTNEARALLRSAADRNTIFATAPGKLVAKSTNLGLSWRAVMGDWGYLAPGTHFVSESPAAPSIVWAGGENTAHLPYVEVSRDCGETWTTAYDASSSDNSCYSIACDPADTNLVYVGMEGQIIKTTDGGDTWSTLYLPPGAPYFYGIAVSPTQPTRVFAAGLLHNPEPQPLVIHLSDDQGEHWVTHQEDEITDHHGVLCMLLVEQGGGDRVFLGTWGAGVFEFALGAAAVGAHNPQATLLLQRCTPNPTRGAVCIVCEVLSPSWVQLVIHDVCGRRVESLIDRVLPAGRHESMWSGTGRRGHRVTPGIYYATLRVGRLVASKRIVVGG